MLKRSIAATWRLCANVLRRMALCSACWVGERFDKVRPIWHELVTAFGLNLQVDAMAAEGNVVAVRYTERGRFIAPFRGTPPTGKSYEVVAMEWIEVGPQGIEKRWGARDSAAIFRQLGIAAN